MLPGLFDFFWPALDGAGPFALYYNVAPPVEIPCAAAALTCWLGWLPRPDLDLLRLKEPGALPRLGA